MECRAARARGGIELDPAAVGLDQALAQSQSDTGMLARLGRESLKYPEYAVLGIQRNPGAVICHREYAITADIRNSDIDAPRGQIMVLDGVADEIAQHALERRLIRDESLCLDLHADGEAGGARQ